MPLNVAVIGSGNIGSDLMFKIFRNPNLKMIALVGIDAKSDGLARARKHDVAAIDTGIEGLLARTDLMDQIDLIFDATSAKAHEHNAPLIAAAGKFAVDLTPAAIGPYVVPPLNLKEHLDGNVTNVNMVTCGGQATIPIIGAIARVQPTLAAIGPHVISLGEIGKAKIMKIALNLNLAAQLLALSEGLLLAVRGGIDRRRALEVMLAGAIASPMLQYRAPFIEELPAKAWFDVSMMQKDCDLALNLGRELGVPLLATAVSREMLSAARGQGLAERDFAVIYYALANAAGLHDEPRIASALDVGTARND